jgi:transketolase
VALCADLIGSLKFDDFKKNHRAFFQIGIAEANMIGIAAGLTIGGKIPFTGTFANFSTGRVYDQIRQSVAYSDKNVKLRFTRRINIRNGAHKSWKTWFNENYLE